MGIWREACFCQKSLWDRAVIYFVMTFFTTRLLRLLDLGFCEESQVVPLYTCPWGGTRLYHVKQTRIALRDSDAAQIQVKAVE